MRRPLKVATWEIDWRPLRAESPAVGLGGRPGFLVNQGSCAGRSANTGRLLGSYRVSVSAYGENALTEIRQFQMG